MFLPGKEGESDYKHYTAVEKATGEKPIELMLFEKIYCPWELKYHFDVFTSLSSRRRDSEAGPLPLTFEEIEAWAFCFNEKPTTFLMDIILRLDELWLKVWRDKHPQK